MAVLVDVDFSRLSGAAASLFPAAPGSFFDLAAWYEVFSRHALDPGSRTRLYLSDAASPPLGLVMQAAGDGELRSLANYYSCEHAVLAPGVADGAAPLRAIVGEMLAERPRWDRISFCALDPASSAFAALRSALGEAGLAVEAWCEFGTWYEATAGLSFADYLARRPSALVNTWRRKAAKTAKAHRLDFVLATDVQALESGIADYETVYRASWKGAEPYPHFMPSLIRRSAELGALRLGVLRIDGVPAAAQFWLHWQGRTTIYKLAHDSRFDALSPGTLLTMRMMESALDIDRAIEVDFGRGDDPYKKLWLASRRERWAIDAANPRTPRGLALAARQVASRLAAPLRRSRQAG